MIKRVWMLIGSVVFITVFVLNYVSAAPQVTQINLPGSRITYSSVATADFNGDGYKEIIVGGGDAMLYVVGTTDGSSWGVLWSIQTNDDILAANPPTSKSTNKIESSPAIADLDNDGHLDIVIAVGGDVHDTENCDPNATSRGNGGVLVYRYNSAWNFSLIESLSADKTRGWPQPRIDQVGCGAGFSNADSLWDGIRTSPALADLDGDGDLEIVVEGIDRRLHAWHHTGQAVAGWPIYSANGDLLWRGGLSSPAVGDLDGDGLPDAVMGTMSPPDPSNYNLGTVWALKGDSSKVSGFPITVEQYIYSSPALADLDGDGSLEIIASSGWGTTGAQNKVYVWKNDGTLFPGWPKTTEATTAAPPAIGDIDNDGELEIVVGCGWRISNNCNKLYAWNSDGSPVSGFPTIPTSPMNWITNGYSMPYTPILADFDGDGTVEIVVAHHGSRGVSIVEPNGVTSDHTTRTLPDGLWASPVVDDVDDDGLLEIIVAGGSNGSDPANSKGQITIWHESGSASSALPWPMFHHDVLRTGLVPNPPQLGVLANVSILHQTGDANPDFATIRLTNTGGGSFDWTVSESIPEVQFAPTSGTVSTSETIMMEVDASGLSNGWTTVGTVTISATEGGEAIQDSPQSFSVKVFVGNLSRVYLPLIIR